MRENAQRIAAADMQCRHHTSALLALHDRVMNRPSGTWTAAELAAIRDAERALVASAQERAAAANDSVAACAGAKAAAARWGIVAPSAALHSNTHS